MFSIRTMIGVALGETQSSVSLPTPALLAAITSWLDWYATHPGNCPGVLYHLLQKKATWEREVALTGADLGQANCLISLSASRDFLVFLVIIEKLDSEVDESRYFVRATAATDGEALWPWPTKAELDAEEVGWGMLDNNFERVFDEEGMDEPGSDIEDPNHPVSSLGLVCAGVLLTDIF